ncbi:MAG: hypothetical protein ACSLFM_00690, partial [Tepidiformaceae bacterium]
RTTVAGELEGSAEYGSCSVTFAGDERIEIQGDGGPAAVGTDYWYSDDELRSALEQLARFGQSSGSSAPPTKTDAEVQREVDEAMDSPEPKLYLLLVNCVDRDDDELSITLFPSGSSTYDDIPFEPGTYAIPASTGASEPGTFGVLFTIGDELYRVSEAGELDITEWDDEGIAGEFSFRAEQMFAEGNAKKLSVNGKFDFECTDGERCAN